MTRFDNFNTLFRLKKLYSAFADGKSVINTNQVSLEYSNADWYTAQKVYFEYVAPFGYEYLYANLYLLKSDEQEVVRHILSVCQYFVKEAKERFAEVCADLGLSGVANDILSYVPLNEDMLQRFVHDFDFQEHANDFVIKVSVMIAFDMYDCTPDNEALNSYFNVIMHGLRMTPHTLRTMKQIKDKTLKLCEKLGIGEAFATDEQTDFPEDDMFELPWKYVVFANKKIFIYHPSEYGKQRTFPYIVYNEKSQPAFNDIKPYLARQASGLWVVAKNNRIVNVFDDDILECIEILHKRSVVNQTWHDKTKPLVSRTASQDEIKKKILQQKSCYLDYLCGLQLSAYNIYYCPENRVGIDSQTDEDGFVFTIKETDVLVKVVYENVSVNRSSVVVIAMRNNYQKVVDAICDYFSSNAVNKRKNFRSLQEKLEQYVYLCQKANHTDFDSWKSRILC